MRFARAELSAAKAATPARAKTSAQICPNGIEEDQFAYAWHEAPDDAVAARFSLMLGMLGDVRIRTLKAFTEQAYREIINSLG
jgi:hypothetical protein